MDDKLPFTSDELHKAFETNLIEYATSQGFDVVKADRKSYKINGFGGLFLFPHGFYHFSSQEKGNIIDFCRIYLNLDFIPAVESILDTNAYENTKTAEYYSQPKTKPKGSLILPPKDKNNDKIIDYLVNTRCIDKEIVNSLILQGKIYQTTTKNKGTIYPNCAFVSFSDNKPMYCSVRGINGKFRQDIENSNKSFGFNIKGKSNRIYVFESPIDAMSHATLTKRKGLDETQDTRISEGGLFDKSLTKYLQANENIKEIVFCFDNDVDGKDFKGLPRNHGQVFAKSCLEKFSKLGYKTYIQTPKNKDFNLDLQAIKSSVLKQLKSIQVKPPSPNQNKQKLKNNKEL
ncbi:MAG: toprim domain-containing protein [Clostridia bacterium]